ncbi:MAG: hypothetical protein ACJAR2_001543 [Ilumatobacter sp.]
MSSDAELRNEWRIPLPSRLGPTNPRFEEIVSRHDAAIDAGFPTYADPLSGFSVFTAGFLATRNYCCASGCRHCPYLI